MKETAQDLAKAFADRIVTLAQQSLTQERARIRQELLEAFREDAERIYGGVCGQPGKCNLPEHVLTVVSMENIMAALDSSCPEPEGKE